MPPPTELLHQLRLRFQHDQHALGARGTKSTLDLVAAFLKGDVGEKEYALAAPAVELEYHRRSVAQAVEHVRLTRELAAPRRHHAELVPDVLDPRHAAARAAATIRFRRGFETRDDLGPLPHASRSAKLYMQQVALETNKTVLGAGRRTIHNSAIANKARWRRITDGNPCAFCAYQAALTAIYPDLNSGMVNYFHANCGCTVTEAYTRDLSPIEQERVDLYERAYQACRDGGLSLTPTNIVAQMREHGHGIVHDATLPSDGSTPAEPGPKPAAGGAGGGGRKPSKTARGGWGDGEPPATITSSEAGWPTATFAPVSGRTWRHILKRHGRHGEADRFDDDIDELVAASIMQLAATNPDLIAKHPVMEGVVNYYKLYGERIFVLGTRRRPDGKMKVNTFMQPRPGSPIIEVWKRYWSNES